MYGVYNILSNINTSTCNGPNREAAGHFGYGISCFSTYFNCHNNTGAGIFGPWCTSSNKMFHLNNNFIYNKANNYGIIWASLGNHELYNNIFYQNIGRITEQFTSEGTILFNKCIFDYSTINGYKTNNINCSFNINSPNLNQITFIYKNKCFLNNSINFQKINFKLNLQLFQCIVFLNFIF